MKARPILFSAPMVRALLAGTKTQTRRIVKGVDSYYVPALDREMDCIKDLDGYPSRLDIAPRNWEVCPYGVPGDLLWVRESFADTGTGRDPERGRRYYFRADYPNHSFRTALQWRPSIHMPRAASRLTLRITDVRVQRLQDISEKDAIAEGVEHDTDGWFDYEKPGTQCCSSARQSYQTLWNSINGAGSWDANPWVWALTFEVIKQNVDAVLAQLVPA